MLFHQNLLLPNFHVSLTSELLAPFPLPTFHVQPVTTAPTTVALATVAPTIAVPMTIDQDLDEHTNSQTQYLRSQSFLLAPSSSCCCASAVVLLLLSLLPSYLVHVCVPLLVHVFFYQFLNLLNLKLFFLKVKNNLTNDT